MVMQKCVLCNKRPAKVQGYCQHCHDKVKKLRREARPEEPVKFLTYRGHVVGLYRKNGGGTLTPRLLSRNAKYLPKNKTLDLNKYCDGFERPLIKEFKKCVLSLANARV